MTTMHLLETGGPFPANFTYGSITGNVPIHQKEPSIHIPMVIPTDTYTTDSEQTKWISDSLSIKSPAHADMVSNQNVANSDRGGYFVALYALEEIVRNRAGQEFLAEALNELEELDAYAAEEELDPPSCVAKELARDILRKLTREVLCDYSVSLWEDGDVVVYSAGAEWRVNVFCRTNGGVSLYVNSPDDRDYENHYQSAQDMPISLVVNALHNISA